MSVFWQGVGSATSTWPSASPGPGLGELHSEWHLDYWTPDNPDARMPAYYSYQNHNTNRELLVDPGREFLKLRNVQLGYTLPRTCGPLGWPGRAYLTARTCGPPVHMGIDLDPEYPWVRADYYPQTKVFSIGTDIGF